MAVPAGFYYKDGFYWKADLSGPYSFDGASTMTLLGSEGGGGSSNASSITIADAGDNFTATNVEDALAELADAPGTAVASAVTIVDAGGYYTAPHVEGALQEIGAAQAADDAALAAHVAAADPHTGYLTPAEGAAAYDPLGAAAAAQAASQPLDSDLTAIAALTTQSFGRSLLTSANLAAAQSTLAIPTTAAQVPVVDAGGNFAATNVETVLAELAGLAVGSNYLQPPVADETAMLALASAVVGNYVKRLDTSTNWQLDALPASTLANWRNLGSVITTSTGYSLSAPNGQSWPLPLLACNQGEPVISGSTIATFTLFIAEATDINHAQIIWTINCGTGTTPDNALASTRFVAYATHPDVWRTGIDGLGSSLSYLLEVPAGVQIIHFGLAGGGSYTADADATFAGTTMGVMLFTSTPAPPYVMVTLLSSNNGGAGTNMSHREMNVMPFVATEALL